MNVFRSVTPARQTRVTERKTQYEKTKKESDMSVEPTISRTAKARFAEQRDRHETHTNQVDVWNDCAYRLMDILGGLGAEPLGDSGIRPDAAQWGGWSGRASREAQETRRRVP